MATIKHLVSCRKISKSDGVLPHFPKMNLLFLFTGSIHSLRMHILILLKLKIIENGSSSKDSKITTESKCYRIRLCFVCPKLKKKKRNWMIYWIFKINRYQSPYQSYKSSMSQALINFFRV